MENKRNLTKELLADCFKELLLKKPFEKITIKTITDKAGLIRPTFYKHFQDKYEVLEWIFQTEIANDVKRLVEEGENPAALLLLCTGLEKNRTFYRRALAITGPNSFVDLLNRYTYDTFLAIAKRYPLKMKTEYPILTHERIARFYTHGLVNLLIDWLKEDLPYTAYELCGAYQYLVSNSVLDLIS